MITARYAFEISEAYAKSKLLSRSVGIAFKSGIMEVQEF